MSKSKNNSFNKRDWYYDEEDSYQDNRDNKQRRKEKRMKNLIRSKNVDRIMDIDDEDYEWGGR